MNNYIQDGETITLTAPAGGVISGTAYKIGQILAVAVSTIAATLPFEGKVTGVFTLPKTSGTAWSEGDLLYWDDTAKEVCTVVAGNFLVGVATEDVASGGTSGPVRLNGTARGDGVSDTELDDDAVDTAAIQDLAVTRGKIALDAVDGTLIEDDAVDSEHVAAGALDTEHYAALSVDAAAIAAASVGAAKVDFFKSTEQTGTGSEQDIAHGLSSTPGLVWWSLSEFADTLAVDFAEGAHDGTNLKVTVTSGAKFFIFALGA